jgi:hypothetical protein
VKSVNRLRTRKIHTKSAFVFLQLIQNTNAESKLTLYDIKVFYRCLIVWSNIICGLEKLNWDIINKINN